jgi:hypothetical protein
MLTISPDTQPAIDGYLFGFPPERRHQQRWREERGGNRHEHHNPKHGLRDDRHSQSELSDNHSDLASRNHPASDAYRVHASHSDRAQPATDELGQHGGNKNDKGKDEGCAAGESHQAEIQADPDKEEWNEARSHRWSDRERGG